MKSRRKRSITGKRTFSDIPITIKPTKSRKIIRRFHFLISKRRILCDKLGIPLSDNDDQETNKQLIDNFLNPELKLQYQFGASCEDTEQKLLRIHTLHSPNELVQCLGYIMNEIHNRGGLQNYQLASRGGQAINRGGDSSRILIRWIQDELHLANNTLPLNLPLSALEIGSLSTENQISTCKKVFNPVVRIDLQTSLPGIEKQDFMQRPLPKNHNQTFHLISCSLVLNFVPTPVQRGKMCMRFQRFLKPNGFLFIVLPLPCINHSRYLDKQQFIQLMQYLGYVVLRYHEARKLCYILLRRAATAISPLQHDSQHQECIKFTKKHKLYDKPGLNNFSIILSRD